MAILAFFHTLMTCKIYPMILLKYFLCIIFCTIINADSTDVHDILNKTLHRLDNINYQLIIQLEQTGKKNKTKHYKVSVYWPEEGVILRQTHIQTIKSKNKRPSSYWEHRFRDGSQPKKWMTLPITGKLIDISKMKARKKNELLIDLDLTESDIKFHEHTLLLSETTGSYTAFVIESAKKGKQGVTKEVIKRWIDESEFMIHKVEYYTKSGRLYKRGQFSDFHAIDSIFFPSQINIEKKKSKSEIYIQIKDIELSPQFDEKLFIPKDK